MSVIPHHQTVATIDWKTVAKLGDIHFIDPRKNFFSVFEDIAQSECVLTESLHGAILADALRTPWQPFQMGHRFNMFKWHDWFKSIDIDIQAIQKYPILCSERLSRPRRAKHAVERVCGKILMYDRLSQKPTRTNSMRELEAFAIALQKQARSNQFHLSNASTLQSILNRLIECIESMQAQYSNKLRRAA